MLRVYTSKTKLWKRNSTFENRNVSTGQTSQSTGLGARNRKMYLNNDNHHSLFTKFIGDWPSYLLCVSVSDFYMMSWQLMNRFPNSSAQNRKLVWPGSSDSSVHVWCVCFAFLDKTQAFKLILVCLPQHRSMKFDIWSKTLLSPTSCRSPMM